MMGSAAMSAPPSRPAWCILCKLWSDHPRDPRLRSTAIAGGGDRAGRYGAAQPVSQAAPGSPGFGSEVWRKWYRSRDCRHVPRPDDRAELGANASLRLKKEQMESTLRWSRNTAKTSVSAGEG